MATFTIEEGFTGAFEVGQRVEFEVQGLPEAVTIGLVAVDADPPNRRCRTTPTWIAPRPVVVGAMGDTGTLTGDADGDDKSVTLTLGDAEATMTPAQYGTRRWGRHHADIDDR